VLSSSDRALLHFLRGWRKEFDPRLWEVLRPEWRDQLRSAWELEPDQDAKTARSGLRQEHAAQARPDLGRVHPSWWVRALRGESPAVRRAVAANVSEAIRAVLCRGLGLSPDDLQPDRPPQPIAVGWALALWTERLVGDLAARADDPPVIVALTRFDLRGVARLVRAAGLVKWSFAGDDPGVLPGRDRLRFEHFRKVLGEPDRRLRRLAIQDVAAVGTGRRHAQARVGMITVSRLLTAVEPFRARWALQHIPYESAKFARSLISRESQRGGSRVRWEAIVLGMAWERLRAEGRLVRDRGGAP
jgi:hypothetical protein